jgi:hypothetical protein
MIRSPAPMAKSHTQPSKGRGIYLQQTPGSIELFQDRFVPFWLL